MILDFLKGRDLLKVLQADYAGRRVERDRLIDWCLQMAETMRYLHKELFMVHRDLHHGNWMVLDDGTIKLIDFGLALNLGEDGISKQMWVYEPFMSPEVLAEEPAGFDADLWYFSAVLYALVHPRHVPPFQTVPMSINYFKAVVHCLTIPSHLKKKEPIPKLPEEVAEYDQLFERCFDYDVTKRADADEIIGILKHIKAGYSS